MDGREGKLSIGCSDLPCLGNYSYRHCASEFVQPIIRRCSRKGEFDRAD